MTDRERQLFAMALENVRTSRFEGSRKAAYTAAGVNAATWARAEGGQSIKDHTLAKITAKLFPRTGGDWRQLLTEDGGLLLTYWDINGIHPDDAGPIERALGIVRDSPQDMADVGKALQKIQIQIGRLELRLGALEAVARGEDPPRLIVEEIPRAAHEDETSIEEEQGHSEDP